MSRFAHSLLAGFLLIAAAVAGAQDDAANLGKGKAPRILFAAGSAELNDYALETLEGVLPDLQSAVQSDSALTIEIAGHADPGEAANTESLALDRAKLVRVFLAARGLPLNRMKAISYADSRPVTQDTSANGRRLNRRVEILLPRGASVASAPQRSTETLEQAASEVATEPAPAPAPEERPQSAAEREMAAAPPPEPAAPAGPEPSVVFEAPAPPAPTTEYESAPAAAVVADRESGASARTVMFTANSVEVPDKELALLGEPAARLKQQLEANSDLAVRVAGHADPASESADAAKLSERRAELVAIFMATRGVPQDRMEAVGYGDSQPVTRKGGADQNRRAEVQLISMSALRSPMLPRSAGTPPATLTTYGQMGVPVGVGDAGSVAISTPAPAAAAAVPAYTPPAAAAPAPVAVYTPPPSNATGSRVLTTVHFIPRSTDIQAGALAELDQVAAAAQGVLARHADATVDVTGHADPGGEGQVAQDLGRRRAEAVAAYLSRQGVARARIRTQSQGASSPVTQDKDRISADKNRRVEVRVPTYADESGG